MTGPDEDLERLLRRALREEADLVHPGGDGLARIRARTAGRSARWWRRPGALAVASGVAAAVAAGVLVGGARMLTRDDGNGVVATAPTSPRPGPAAKLLDVPVYYLADMAGAPWLYREFRRVPDAGGPARTAVLEMLRGEPLDPDYDSVWPAETRLLDYSVDGDIATVNLSAEARDARAGAEVEARSVQQLVYTVTAADPDVTRVRLLVEGEIVQDLWGHGAVGQQPIGREPRLAVQGQVWIIDPQQGAVTTSPVAVRIFGTGFEGTVTLRVWRADERVVDTFVTTAGDRLAEATRQIPLAPGDYTIRAYNEHGEEQTLVEWDSKDFTVR